MDRKCLLCVVVVCCVVHCSDGVNVTSCGSDGVVEVIAGKTNNEFTCTGLNYGQHAHWHIMYTSILGIPTIYVASTCNAGTSAFSCGSGYFGPAGTGERLSATSIRLTVNAPGLSDEGRTVLGRSTLRCTDNTVTSSCQTDYVVAVSGRCTVQTGTGDQRYMVSGQCLLNAGAMSARNRFRCEWGYMSSSASGSIQPLQNVTLTSQNYQTECRLPSQGLQTVTGVYNYKVKVIPGGDVIDAGSVTVSQPPKPADVTCSPTGFVPVNTPVTCSCTASVGHPQGRLKWVKVTDNSDIKIGAFGVGSLEMTSSLTLTDHGKTLFRCDVDWMRVVQGTPTYIAMIGLPPTNISLKINNSQSPKVNVTEGQVMVTCSAEGRPTPNVTLVHQDSQTQLASGVSSVTWTADVTCEDSGLYVCQSSNNIGPAVTGGHTELFVLSVKSDAQSADEHPTTYLPVVVVLVVVVTLVVMVDVVVVAWLWRRGWVIPCADHKSTERVSYTPEPTIGDGNIENGSDSVEPQERGSYDDLVTSEIGLQSPYAQFGRHDNTESSPYEGTLDCGGDANDRFAEVVRGKADNSFTCSGLNGVTASWSLVDNNGVQTATLGICPTPSNNADSCTSKDLAPLFVPKRTTSASSDVTVNPTATGVNLEAIGSISLKCNDDSCLMDYVVLVTGTCRSSITITSSPWRVDTRCTWTAGNSTRNRYACRFLYRKDGATTDVEVSPWGPMSPNNLNNGDAQCNNVTDLPPDNGRYGYKVQVRPGRHYISSDSLDLRRPDATSWTCQPSGLVAENDTVTCTCTADLGQPAGSLRWVKVQGSQVVTEGANNLALSKKLSRDDNGTKYRCDTLWSNQIVQGQQEVTLQVGYPASKAELRVTSTGGLAVNDLDTVTFTCTSTGGNPSPTLRLTGPRATFSPSGPSPLTSDLDRATCDDSGQFTCTARTGYGNDVISTVNLTVNCKPRSSNYNIGDVNFGSGFSEVVTLLFDVTAYPGPLTLTLTFLGNNSYTERPVLGISISGSCEQLSPAYQHRCAVTVANISHASAAGLYRVQVSNTLGSADFSLTVRYTGALSADKDPPSYLSVVIALAVVVALMAMSIVVYIVWLWRRGWTMPCTDHKSTERVKYTSEPAPASTDGNIEIGSDGVEPQERGPYDDLVTSQIGLQSPYAQFGRHDNAERSLYEGILEYVNVRP